MYVFFNETIKQERFSASRSSLFEVCMFNIYIYPFRLKFCDLEKEEWSLTMSSTGYPKCTLTWGHNVFPWIFFEMALIS